MKKHVGAFNTILYLTDKEAKKICRLGKGEKCCPWLVVSKKGFECYRMNYPANTSIHDRVDKGTMNAKGKECDWYETEKLATEE